MTEPVSDDDLEELRGCSNHVDRMIDELLARRKAEMEAKPVAWKDKVYGNLHHQDWGGCTPLYLHPAPAQNMVSEAIHYPDCWDVAAYPTLESALAEVYGHFKCTNDQCGKQNTGNEDEATRWRHGEKVSDYEAGYKQGLADCEAGFVKVPVESVYDEDGNRTALGLDEIIHAMYRHDSYGVYGSDFVECRVCQTQNGPGKFFKDDPWHEEGCIVPQLEAMLSARPKP